MIFWGLPKIETIDIAMYILAIITFFWYGATMKNMEREKKTSQDWQLQYPKPKVLDPDGWDRTNFQYSWYEELITYEEYRKRLMCSTVIGKSEII